jgi:hypothetical protein
MNFRVNLQSIATRREIGGNHRNDGCKAPEPILGFVTLNEVFKRLNSLSQRKIFDAAQ